MTMRTATGRLWQTVHQLREDLLALRLQAVEDRPLGESNKLVDDVGTVCETLTGWAEEILDGAARAVAAADPPDDPPDLAGIRRALDACTDRVERLGAQLHAELTATGCLDNLNALARRGTPELRAWVGAIKRALDQTQQSLWTAHAALTACWRELADRAVPGPAPEPTEATDTARRT